MATFSDKLTRWGAFSANFAGMLPDFPHLAGDHELFQQTIAEGLTLAAQQDAQTAALRVTIAKREEVETRGNHLREYLAAAVRRKFGVNGPNLAEFGLRPRSKKRKPAGAVEGPTPVTPQPPQPKALAAAPAPAEPAD